MHYAVWVTNTRAWQHTNPSRQRTENLWVVISWCPLLDPGIMIFRKSHESHLV